MSEQDYIDVWSSDGDSVSSDSSSSDSETLASSDNDEHRNFENVKGTRYLKRAGIFTREEVIEQAIGCWSAYIRLCGRAMSSLRETMVEAYVKDAIETKSRLNSTFSVDIPTTATINKTTAFGDSSSGSKHHTHGSSQRSAELRALRRFGRHSRKVENAKRAAAVSKFAIMSTLLAPWQRSSGGHQSCKYRDPTTTTWEHRCNRPCVPLLPYCAVHLVLLEDSAPSPQSSSIAAGSTTTVQLRDVEAGGDGEGSSMSVSSPVLMSALGKPQKPPSRKSTSTKSRSTADGVASFSDVQFPPQFLFRKCGGGPNNDCTEPVIAWTVTTRCPQHADLDSVFPLAVAKEEVEGEETEEFQAFPPHPLLVEYLRKWRHDRALH